MVRQDGVRELPRLLDVTRPLGLEVGREPRHLLEGEIPVHVGGDRGGGDWHAAVVGRVGREGHRARGREGGDRRRDRGRHGRRGGGRGGRPQEAAELVLQLPLPIEEPEAALLVLGR